MSSSTLGEGIGLLRANTTASMDCIELDKLIQACVCVCVPETVNVMICGARKRWHESGPFKPARPRCHLVARPMRALLLLQACMVFCALCVLPVCVCVR